MIRGIGALNFKYFSKNVPALRHILCPNKLNSLVAQYGRTDLPCSTYGHFCSINVLPATFSSTSSSTSGKLLLAFGVAALLKFLGLSNEDDSEESELVRIIKKGELALLKKEYDKSEQLFHLALKVAQELRNESGVTYIYDRLANIAFDSGRHEKARKLFVNVMQRLLDNGMAKDDLVLIHISFKLAKIFENIGDYRTADIGFQYCLETLKPQLNQENAEYADALALWQIILNGYAYYLYYVGRANEALKYFEEARAVREQIGSEDDEQLVLLLNNLGTASKLKGDVDQALRYFHQAEKLGKNFPDMESFSYVYLNLAYLYMELKMLAKAREYCERAATNAKRHQFDEGQRESEECLDKVKEALG